MSWIPFAGIIEDKESILIIFISFILFVTSFNLNGSPLSITNSKFKYKLPIYFLLLSFIISTILFNPQELSSIVNILNLIALFLNVLIFTKIFPEFIIFNPIYFEKFVKLLTLFGIVTAIFGLLLLASGYQPNQMAVYLISFIRHPNGVSIIFSITIVSTLYYYYWKKDTLPIAKRYFYIFSIVIQFIAELLTQSRTGILGVVVSLIVFFFFQYRKKIILLLPLFIVGINFFVLTYIVQKGAASFISRFRLWLVAYNLIMKESNRLYWGYGFTESNILFKKNASIYAEIVEHPHNAYISILLMFGVIFLSIFILFMIILSISNVIKLVKAKCNDEKLFYNFILSLMLSFLFQGLFESPLVLFWYFMMPVFLIILGFQYLILKNNPLICKLYV